MLLRCPKQWLANMKTFNIVLEGRGGDLSTIFKDFGYFCQKSVSVANGFVRDYRRYAILNDMIAEADNKKL